MGPVEQQIYASLAQEGLKAGHHTHAATPGLEPELIEHHEGICNRWGQYDAAAPFTRSLVHLPLFDQVGDKEPSAHLVLLITEQGRDAGGRPGAMLRHIVRLDHRTYLSFGCNPFQLWRRKLLLEHWDELTPMPTIVANGEDTSASDLASIFPERYALLRSLLERLLQSGRIHLPSATDSPAGEETLAQLLELLPVERRARLAMATFAYANPNQYDIAVIRQEGASLRQSLLDAASGADAAGLSPEDRSYVDNLFAALERRDWDGASNVIHGTEKAQPVQPPREESASVTRAAPEPRPAPEPIDEEDEFRPSFRRGPAPKKGPSPWVWIVGVGALAAVVVGAWMVFGSNSNSKPKPSAPAATSTAVQAAADLNELVDSHVDALASAVEAGARDFDLSETIRGMHKSLSSRVQATITAERQQIDQRLKSNGGVAFFTQSSKNAAGAVARLAALEDALATNDVAVFRQAYDTETQALALPEAEPTGSSAIRAAEWSESLQRSVDILAACNALTAPGSARSWQAIADSAAVLAASGATPPTAITQLSDAVLAGAPLLEAWTNTPVQQGAGAWDLDEAMLGAAEARANLKTARAALDRSLATVPKGISALADWSSLADDLAALTQRQNSSSAATLLRKLDRLTDEGGTLDFRFENRVEDWFIRCRLEAWLALGGPSSVQGNGVRSEIADGFAVSSLDEITRVVDDLEEMRSAPSPAPANFVDAIRRRSRGENFAAVYRSLYEGWLRQQSHGRAIQEQGFANRYRDLKRALTSFTSSPSASSWKSLVNSRSQLSTARLRDSGAAANFSSEIQATTALAAAMQQAVEVSLASMQVRLLQRVDYSGTERQLAQIRVEIRRAKDSELLYSSVADPIIAPPGAPFDTVSMGAGNFEVKADASLVLVVRDERSGEIWCHAWFEADDAEHVLSKLGGTHQIRVAQASRSGKAELPARPRVDGDPLAEVVIELQSNWWARLAASLPSLP